MYTLHSSIKFMSDNKTKSKQGMAFVDSTQHTPGCHVDQQYEQRTEQQTQTDRLVQFETPAVRSHTQRLGKRVKLRRVGTSRRVQSTQPTRNTPQYSQNDGWNFSLGKQYEPEQRNKKKSRRIKLKRSGSKVFVKQTTHQPSNGYVQANFCDLTNASQEVMNQEIIDLTKQNQEIYHPAICKRIRTEYNANFIDLSGAEDMEVDSPDQNFQGQHVKEQQQKKESGMEKIQEEQSSKGSSGQQDKNRGVPAKSEDVQANYQSSGTEAATNYEQTDCYGQREQQGVETTTKKRIAKQDSSNQDEVFVSCSSQSQNEVQVSEVPIVFVQNKKDVQHRKVSEEENVDLAENSTGHQFLTRNNLTDIRRPDATGKCSRKLRRSCVPHSAPKRQEFEINGIIAGRNSYGVLNSQDLESTPEDDTQMADMEVIAGRKRLFQTKGRVESIFQQADNLRIKGNTQYQEASTISNLSDRNKGLESARDTYDKAITVIRSSKVSGHPNIVALESKICSNQSAVFLLLEEYDEALQLAQQAVTVDPSYLKGQLRLVTCHLRRGDLSSAKSTLQSLENQQQQCEVQTKQQEVQQAEEYLQQIISCRSSSDIEGLEAALKGFSGTCSGWCDLQLITGEIAILQQKTSAVQRIVDKTVCNRDRYQQAVGFFIYFQGLFYIGDWDRLEKDLKPDDRKILDLIDTSFHSNADQNKQLISQQISKPRKEDLVLFRDNFFAAQKMRLDANDKYKSKQYDQALNLYDQIIKQYGKFLHPKMVAQLCLQKGSILFKQNLYILSASEFLKSVALDPKFFEAYREIAAVYTQLRLHEMAQEMYQRIGNQPEASRSASIKRQQPTPNMFLILNLPQQCTDREVEKAYRKLALNIHPDKIQSSCPFSTSLCQQGCLQQVQQNVIFERLKSEFRNLFSQLSQAKDRLTTQTQRQQVKTLLNMEQQPRVVPSTSGTPNTPQNPPPWYQYQQQQQQQQSRHNFQTPQNQQRFYQQFGGVYNSGQSQSGTQYHHPGFSSRYPHYVPRSVPFQRRGYHT